MLSTQSGLRGYGEFAGKAKSPHRVRVMLVIGTRQLLACGEIASIEEICAKLTRGFRATCPHIVNRSRTFDRCLLVDLALLERCVLGNFLDGSQRPASRDPNDAHYGVRVCLRPQIANGRARTSDNASHCATAVSAPLLNAEARLCGTTRRTQIVVPTLPSHMSYTLSIGACPRPAGVLVSVAASRLVHTCGSCPSVPVALLTHFGD